MKRSIMVKEIYQLLEGYEDPGKQERWDDADLILSVLEKRGMLPPLEKGRRVEDLDLGLPEWEEEFTLPPSPKKGFNESY